MMCELSVRTLYTVQSGRLGKGAKILDRAQTHLVSNDSIVIKKLTAHSRL